MITCPRCGHQAPDGTPYCPNCGYGKPVQPPAQTPQLVTCSRCGSRVDASVKFCPNCGNPRSQTVKTQLTGSSPTAANSKKPGGKLGLLIGGLFIIFFIWAIVGSSQQKKYDVAHEATRDPSNDYFYQTKTAEAILAEVYKPTKTPESTNTPAHTNTPEPTIGPVDPVVIQGVNSDIVQLPFVMGFIKFDYDGSSYYGITSYDANNERVELLFNNAVPVHGIVPYNINRNDNADKLQVEAQGNWTLTIYDSRIFFYPEYVLSGNKRSGTYSDVFFIPTDTYSTVTLDYQSDRYLNMFAYTETGRDLLYNDSDPSMSGTKLLPNGTFLITIEAEAPWSVTLE